jgi:hypothetical protein
LNWLDQVAPALVLQLTTGFFPISRGHVNTMSKLLIPMVCLVGACVVVAGCGGASYDGDKRFPLSGTATFDGQPIDLGSISLIPVGGGAGEGGGRATGEVIQDGKYSISEEKGPTAGKYRAEVSWLKLTGRRLKDPDTGEMYDERKEALPDKYVKGSEITIEVPAPENTHNLELKSN